MNGAIVILVFLKLSDFSLRIVRKHFHQICPPKATCALSIAKLGIFFEMQVAFSDYFIRLRLRSPHILPSPLLALRFRLPTNAVMSVSALVLTTLRRFEDRPTLRNAGEREPFERTVGGGVLPATALLGIAGRNHPSARA